MTAAAATGQGTPGMSLRVAGAPVRVREAWQGALAARSAEVGALCAALADDPSLRCLAFYQSPWDAFAMACRDVGGADDAGRAGVELLRAWADDAAQLLEAAGRWPSRVVLVNADRLASREAALAELLVRESWCSGVDAPVLDEAPRLVDTGVLARLFEDYAPDAWDAYESLESQARLLGRGAEFRATLKPAGDPLVEALAVWSDAITVRQSACEPQATDGAAAESGPQVLEALRAELAGRERLLQEIGNENELLLEHVAQLRQELLDQGETNRDLREMVVRLTAAADQARLLISK